MQILTDTQQVSAVCKPKTASGAAARVDGIPQWSTSNPSVATVTPSDDGLTCVVKAAGIGTTQIGVVADADLGEGVREITTVDDVEVKASEAVTIGIEWGVPEEQGGTATPQSSRSRR